MSLRVTLDTATPELRRLERMIGRSRPLIEAGAKAVQKGIVTHLRSLQKRGNEKGWPSQGFFAGSSDSVEGTVGVATLTDRGAVVVIADARFAHRIKGGRVSPKRRSFLAIPLRPEAYALSGKGSIRESAPDLKLRGRVLGKESGETFEPWFALVKSVTHSPHPEELPPAEDLSRLAGAAMERAARLLARIA